MARAETVRIEGLAELNRALRELPQRIANRGLRTAVYAGAKVYDKLVADLMAIRDAAKA